MIKTSKRHRNCFGASQVEFAAVFAVFILIILFPMFNFIALAAMYAAGAALNYDSCREASLVSDTGSVNGAQHVDATAADAAAARDLRVKNVEAAWGQTGLGQFVKTNGGPGAPTHTIVVTPAAAPSTDEYLRLTTDINVDPFLNIPWFTNAPGFNAPMHFTYSQERLVEQ